MHLNDSIVSLYSINIQIPSTFLTKKKLNLKNLDFFIYFHFTLPPFLRVSNIIANYYANNLTHISGTLE